MNDMPHHVRTSIKAAAASEWPGDYSMQAHVIEEQTLSYRTMAAYRQKLSGNKVGETAIEKALTEWPDDYTMQVHVVEEQTAAAKAFFEYADLKVPSNIVEEIRARAFSEWPGDYEMMLHELQGQIEGWLQINS